MTGLVFILLSASVAYARCFDGHIEYCSWMYVSGSEAFVYDGWDFRVTSDDNFDWGRHKPRSIMPPSDRDCTSSGSVCWAPGKEVSIELHSDFAKVKIGDGSWRRVDPYRKWHDYPYDCVAIRFVECG
ncbi:hypothetical protein BGZ81_004269 [Podila clonocystis]|nr:hypothetical protein BGZ81_004269 [Podila clonocystis]